MSTTRRWWTPWTEGTREQHAERALAMGVDVLMNSDGWETDVLTINGSAFPNGGINATAAYFRGRGLDPRGRR